MAISSSPSSSNQKHAFWMTGNEDNTMRMNVVLHGQDEVPMYSFVRIEPNEPISAKVKEDGGNRAVSRVCNIEVVFTMSTNHAGANELDSKRRALKFQVKGCEMEVISGPCSTSKDVMSRASKRYVCWNKVFMASKWH